MSYTSCTNGDDTTCTAIGGAPTCCYALTLVDKPEKPTSTQQQARKAFDNIKGWPKDEGETFNYCATLAQAQVNDKAAEAAGGDDGEWTDVSTGEKYRGLCSGAVAKASAAIAALAASVVAATY